MSHQQKALHNSLFRRVLRWVPKNKGEYQKKKIPFFFLILTFIIAIGIIGKVTWTTYLYVTNFDIQDFLAIMSADMETDDKGRTNILLLGAGGGDHDGADLTDTIMIASINREANAVSLLSIPRDLWLDIPSYGSSRINKIYDTLKGKYGAERSLDIFREGVENITNIDIPYTIKIDFQGFVDAIDTLGGIEVVVEKSIFDSLYPTPDGRYETFSIDAGTHILDGETALKYARSRHSTSDFDRAERQQNILNAIKTKAQNTDLLGSPLLVKRLFEDFSDHIETNMSTTELISLAQIAKDLHQESITTAVLKDIDIIDVGSFLFTPDRALYGGAFVLIPIGNSYQAIHRFINLVFDHADFFHENATIQMLNGTNQYGLVASAGEKLLPYGFNIQRYGNADRKDYANTHFYVHKPGNTFVTEQVIKEFFPDTLKIKGRPPEGIDTDYDITIILGEDFDLKTFLKAESDS